MLFKNYIIRRSILESSLFNDIFKYKSTHTYMNELCITCVQFLLHSCQFSKLLWFIQQLQLRSSFQVPRKAHIMCTCTPQKLHYTTELGQGRKVREQDQITSHRLSSSRSRHLNLNCGERILSPASFSVRKRKLISIKPSDHRNSEILHINYLRNSQSLTEQRKKRVRSPDQSINTVCFLPFPANKMAEA